VFFSATFRALLPALTQWVYITFLGSRLERDHDFRDQESSGKTALIPVSRQSTVLLLETKRPHEVTAC
jgi:hypothetical protein